MWEMDPHGISLGRGGGGNNGTTGDGFVDRSKVRILLCDNDSKGSGEVFTLLCKCSYQVISVKSPRQVIDALNAEGPNIDIILSEVDLPMAKGLKMLKYIMRKELRRIPVIMMSAQDEVTLVVKCLRLGAADYLVKPLRTNELLNLWTHMWRRRRMLGLAEKKMMNYEFDLVPSDPSDANTNSTMFSDDTDEKLRKSANPEMSVSIHRGDEINMILASGPADKQLINLSNDLSNLPGTNEIKSGPKKSELKIGQSSAFFTYVKSNISKRTTPGVSLSIHEDNTPLPTIHKQPILRAREVDNLDQNTRINLSQIDNFPINNGLDQSSQQINPNPHSAYPYNLHGAMNMMSSTYYPHQHMTSFPYYPVNLCLQPGQMPAVHPWGSYGGSLTSDGKVQTVDRREAALLKFRQKRKERCFDKKIRYVNRKKLAEKRPRVRGQFVRKGNGIDMDLNGEPTCTDFDDEDDDEEEEDRILFS